jgi:phage tail sheath gpL-like
MATPRNPDLPRSWRRAGTYIYFSLAGGAGATDISRRLLILGERSASGQRPPDALYPVTSEQDVIDGSGRGSTPHREYLAAMSQVGEGIVETYVGHVNEPSAGTAATYPFKLTGPATSGGYVQASICGLQAAASFVSGDSAATVAAALKAELDKLVNAPCTFTISTDTITATFRHKGAHGEDMPARFYVTPGSGIRVGPGDILYANAASGAGTSQIQVGSATISAAIANSDSAATIATATNTAINSADFPLTSSVNSGTLSLYFANNQDVRRVTARILTSTGTTVAANGGSAAATATCGTAGAGAPSLTALLSTIEKQAGFGSWVAPWTDLTTLGGQAQHIELEGNGLRQKGQKLHVCLVTSLASAGAVPAGTSPTLTSSTRYVAGWQLDSAQQGYELAARMAAARAANDYAGKNWRGFQFRTNARVPLLAPSARASSPDINSALNTYALCPIYYDDALGRNVLDWGRTTSTSDDRALHYWSTIDQLDYQRSSAIGRMNDRFGEASFKRTGLPATPNTIDAQSIEEEMYLLTRTWEAEDVFDGAEALRPGIKAAQDSSDPAVINLTYTASVVIPVIQIGVVANYGSATA